MRPWTVTFTFEYETRTRDGRTATVLVKRVAPAFNFINNAYSEGLIESVDDIPGGLRTPIFGLVSCLALIAYIIARTLLPQNFFHVMYTEFHLPEMKRVKPSVRFAAQLPAEWPQYRVPDVATL